MDLSKKQFGGKAKDYISLYEKSPQWNGKKFINLKEVKLEFSFQNLPNFLRKQICERKHREPQNPLKVAPFDKEAFLAPSERVKYIWYGHSVLLIRLEGKTILIDPMFGQDTSPIAPFKTKRFFENSLSIIDDLPPIDLILLSHDHYDHLDLDSILKLKEKCKIFFTSLGVERHLILWGIAKEKITSFDWWDHHLFGDIQIHFTPTQHASGRGIASQSKCLWGGWVMQTEKESIYFSGDGGYNTHFKKIGAYFSSFDIGFMECGQYNENWHAIHMYPEESIQAALDTKIKIAVPVHWCGFALAQHQWKEPVQRFIAAAKENNQLYHLPELGKLNGQTSIQEEWFTNY